MFVRVASLSLFLLALPLLVVADCDTGDIQCCNSVRNADDPTMPGIMQLLGITAPLTGQVGFNCSPLTAVGGASGAGCTQQSVCCTDNKFNGLVNFGCSSVNSA